MINLELAIFNLIYITAITTFLHGISEIWSKTKQQLNKQSNMERDKLPSLKLKLYIFFSANAEQWQDQKKIPVKQKKYDSSTGRMIYISGLTIGRNPYSSNIKPADFQRAPGEGQAVPQVAVQRRRWQKHPVWINTERIERSRTPWNSSNEEHLHEDQVSTRTCQGSAPE